MYVICIKNHRNGHKKLPLAVGFEMLYLFDSSILPMMAKLLQYQASE